jgi:hypothetical protein
MSLRKKLLIPLLLLGFGTNAIGKSVDYVFNEMPAIKLSHEQIRERTPELGRIWDLERQMNRLDIIMGYDYENRNYRNSKEILKRLYEDPSFLEAYSTLRRKHDSLNSLKHVVQARENLENNKPYVLMEYLFLMGVLSTIGGFVSIPYALREKLSDDLNTNEQKCH